MITTRTRILSILATVAMLVSMLACFVIPASAAEISDYVEVWNDIASGADNLSALIDENGVKDAATTVDQLKAAAEADAATIVWKEFVWDSEPFPRYALKEAYDAAGYNTTDNANVWSISAPADWRAMIDAADYATLATDAETFEGYTFHVTQDIDFENVDMYPLNLSGGKYYYQENDRAFQGTIQGHNHAFKNISVIDPLATTTTITNRVFGMIGKLGDGAVIENFGVDSGTITSSTTCDRNSVSTFGVGCPSATSATAPVLHNVWSGADISASGGSKGNFAGGILGISADTKGLATINGAYFDGTLSADTTYGILYNIRTGGVYNALSNPATAAYAISLQTNATISMFKNIYSVGYDPVNTNASITATNITENKCGNAASVEVGAHELNKLQTTSPVSDMDPVYFTWVTNSLGETAIRPTGDENNQIVKVTVAGVDDPLYVNLNTQELTKDYLVELTGNDTITGYALNGGDAVAFASGEDYIELAADSNNEAIITFTINAEGALEEAKAEYNNLLAYSEYLTDEAITAIGVFVSDETTTDNYETREDTLLEALKTYSTYPAEGNKKVPGYKLAETLGAYNTDHVWTINEAEDWLKMVDDSVANDFKDYVFHVTDNIDFSTETDPMLPLNYGDDALKDQAYYPFNGTIEGYGNAFENINVQVTISNSGKQCATGMIGKLGQYAEINNFGVDSGTIHAIGDADAQPERVYVATFGEPMNKAGDGSALTSATPSLTEQYAKLNNVWSGADLIAEGAADDTNYASGIVVQAQNSYMVINGAFFYGSLQGKTLAGITENQTRVNVYNALNDNTSTAAMFVTTATNGALNNVYSTRGNKVETTVAVKPTNTNQNNETGEVPSCTAEEAAWMLNSANVTAAAADGVAKVYFTKVGDAIRFGEESNRIVKVTVNETEHELYVNNGTTLDKAYFADLYEVGANAITVSDVTGGTYENDILTVSGDTTVAITIDYTVELENVRKNYDLDAKYLTDTAASVWNTFMTAEAADSAAAKDILDTEDALIEALTGGVYTTYPAEGDKAVPGYKDVKTYGEYNTANVWTINSTEDWLKMVEDSNLDPNDSAYVPKNFENHIFYVTGNINFSEAGTLKPLNLGNGIENSVDNPYFQGTIYGNGFEFQGINVLVEATAAAKYNGGLIGKFGEKAIINDLGIDSNSTICVDGKEIATQAYASSFGEPVVNKAGRQLNRVWSGATVVAKNATTNMVAGIVAGGQDSKTVVNGAYFFGTLDSGANAYGIYHQLKTEYVYNALSDPKTINNTSIVAMNKRYVSSSSGPATAFALKNSYSVGTVPVYTDVTDTDTMVTNCGNAETAAAGAYEINKLQATNSVADVDPVYYTFVGEGEDRVIRPTGNAGNMIVKVTVTDGTDTLAEGYINKGESIDKQYVADLLGLTTVTAITSATIGDGDMGDSYQVPDDTTINVVLDEAGTLQAQLTDKIAEYDGLDVNYFKTTAEINEDGKIGLADFLTLAASNVVDDLNKAIDAITDGGDWTLVDEITTDYTKVPAYKLRATYGEYQPAVANWLIADKADWYEMDAEANKVDGDTYFADTIFHLKDDVDFAQDGSGDEYTDYMWPLGSYDTKAFAGTINGHGYGFENVYIRSFTNTDSNYKTGYSMEHGGLFAFLNGATIEEFGINSGTVFMRCGGGEANVSTFGGVATGGTVTFNKVWSGATLDGNTNNHVSALVGATDDDGTAVVKVNGFAFYGTVKKKSAHSTANRNVAYGVYGGRTKGQADYGTFMNIISNPTNDDTAIIPTVYLFGFTDETAATAALDKMSNVYGLGDITQTYRVGTTTDDITNGATNSLVKDMTEFEAAYEINGLNKDLTDPVLFKRVGNAIRPTGTASEYLVKVTVTGIGEEPAPIYINTNEEYTKAELAAVLGLNEADITTVVADENATVDASYVLTVTADNAAITVTTCEHSSYVYTYIDGAGKHTITCGDCGAVLNESKTCSGTVGVVIVPETGEAYKERTCTLCGGYYKKNCDNATLTPNAEDCTQNSVWVVDCCDEHSALDPVEKPDSGNATHTFGDTWTEVEGTNKSYQQCVNCETKQYKIDSEITATGLTLAPQEDGTIEITLPGEIKTAELTFGIPEGYTIDSVVGATLDGEVYKVIENVANVTVTLVASKTAIGGTFTVDMKKAVARDETIVEIADAQAQAIIIFNGVNGDANGDNNVNLADALAALYIVAGKTGATPINVANANVDTTTDGVTVEDVYAIVKLWLTSIIG